MKLILLRGAVPKDRNPNEVKYGSLEKSTDIYEHMAYQLGDEGCEIIYYGGKYEKSYSKKCKVKWVKKLEKYRAPFTPDVVWVRGGFKEGYDFAKRYPKAFKIYYGAGKRYCPERGRFDLVLADSEQQAERIRKKGYHAALWWKPAPPQFKQLPSVEKKYDVCYVAAIPEDKRKNCKWVYKTCPKHLKVLQLGYAPKKLKVPKSFTVKRIGREKMPKALNKCNLLITPYGKEDGGPRIITEALACGLGVQAFRQTRYWEDKICENGWVHSCWHNNFWRVVVTRLDMNREEKSANIVRFYSNNLSMPEAVKHLRRLINGR